MSDDNVGDSGYSVADLSAYLDRGRVPRIGAIEANPECQAMLASLERLAALGRDLVSHEAGAAGEPRWIDALIAEVGREARAGRDVPLVDDDPGLVITEGAVRGAIRDAGDAIAGAIVSRTAIVGELTFEGSVSIELSISVLFGTPIPEAAEAVREAVRRRIEEVVPLRVTSVDVTVVDVSDVGSAFGDGAESRDGAEG